MIATANPNAIKFDLYYNDHEDVTDMKLAPASATGVVTLTLADSTNRTLAWNKN